jgi:phage shock protein A
VAPHKKELQEAAEAHYKAISELQKEQHRLIDEADRIQRTIDELEKKYQDMTTPRPQN